MQRVLPSASIQNLQLRARTVRTLREFFDQQGFVEVFTPILSSDTVIDRHLDPFAVQVSNQTNVGPNMWLQTSPEFAMKRLLAAGMESIYQLTHAFREDESGNLHNPEFEMLEWYRVGDDFQQGIKLLCDVAGVLFDVEACELITYREAFLAALSIDPFKVDTARLVEIAHQHVGRLPQLSAPSPDRALLLDLLLSECVQPRLGTQQPTVLYNFPADQAALAKTSVEQGDEVAERFELYYRGIELANGYHELTDADELLRRNQKNNQLRKLDGKPTLPEHSRLLDAMERGIPECAGVAMGIDRVVMLQLGEDEISQVLAFPFDRA